MALVVFTGGARSGKSAAAERLAASRHADGQRVVVAVFGREDDLEMADRIRAHRLQRPAGFETLECGSDLTVLSSAAEDSLLLVDCLGTLLGACMELAWERCADSALGEHEARVPPGMADAVAELFDPQVASLLARAGDTIVVTNEVGDGVVPAHASGRLFRDLLGRANRRIVTHADAAYLCVAGRLIDLTSFPSHAAWPHD